MPKKLNYRVHRIPPLGITVYDLQDISLKVSQVLSWVEQNIQQSNSSFESSETEAESTPIHHVDRYQEFRVLHLASTKPYKPKTTKIVWSAEAKLYLVN